MTKPSMVFAEAKNIYLRPLTEQDASDDYVNWFNDEEVCAGNSHYRFLNTQAATLAYIESVNRSDEKIVLAIIDKSSDKHIGNVSLQSIDTINRSAEFAIIIGEKSTWGKSFGFDALQLIIQHGFNQLNLHRIYCGTFSSNIGMQQLAKKIGMTEVGRRREAVFKAGEYLDIIEYDLLRSEFIIK